MSRLAIAVTVLILLLGGIFYLVTNKSIQVSRVTIEPIFINLLNQEKSNQKSYCNYSSSLTVQEVWDCKSYIVIKYGCCDIPDTILDNNGNKIMRCGGIAGYSKECEEFFLNNPQNNCSVSRCDKK